MKRTMFLCGTFIKTRAIKTSAISAALICQFFLSLPAIAQQADITINETVRGNEEQPKVLTIVPWQSPSGPEYLYRPLNSRLEQLFKPVERAELRRQLHFISITEQESTKGEQ